MHNPSISMTRVAIGGLAAGIVLIVLNVGAQLLIGAQVERDVNAWIPGASAHMQVSGAATVLGLLAKLVMGIVAIGLYAGVLPRWGPGHLTAGRIAVAVWLLGAIFFSDFPLTGMMSWTTYAALEALQLIALLAATWLGAHFYRESPRSQ